MSAAGEIGRVRVDLAARGYDILVGPALLAQAGEHIRPMLRRPLTAIVTDATIAALHLDSLREALGRVGIAAESIVLPPGEASKSFANLELLTDRLLDLKLERSDMVIAFGGGVIGDLTGFAASVLRRGMDFIQIPTTLLSQVDSSVGGKTAINTRHGKNLIGSFHQPRLVLADVSLLDSLPRRELLAGYAEVVKYGLLGDAEFFAWLERHGAALLAGDLALRREAVMRSCAAKAAIVQRDEREDGERALLNLGHTFGHALEAAQGFGAGLLHGEAVAIGMVCAFALSAALGHCSPDALSRIEAHLGAVGLPTRPFGGKPEQLLELMRQDKKVSGGRMSFILARSIGQSFISRDVSEAAVLDVLRRLMGDNEPIARSRA